MNEKLIQASYDLSKKSRLKRFYDDNKKYIFSIIVLIIVIAISFGIYTKIKENKKILLSENYIEARIYFENGEIDKAKKILKNIIFENDTTYSTLSLFLLSDQNLIEDKNELKTLFDQVLKNNKFDNEIENLIIYKKALLQSTFVSESELLEITKPLINSQSLWKPHALLLLGDYFFYKKEYVKSKEFYIQILNLKNLNKDLYEQARSQLTFMANE
mgnify:CR=1 FL=1|tara:strand:+ start:204 stop:851 length:648 start_codon:yes stop_codon:yes gene_type:complete